MFSNVLSANSIGQTVYPLMCQCRFAALPLSQSTVFQLCDLHHPDLQALLEQQTLAEHCSETTGISIKVLHYLMCNVTRVHCCCC